MSLLALSGDPVVTVHGSCPDDPPTCGSFIPDVLVGGVPVHYVGGVTTVHMYNPPDCDKPHSLALEANMPSFVFVYPVGLPIQIARVGDKYTGCGVIGASPTNFTVFAY